MSPLPVALALFLAVPVQTPSNGTTVPVPLQIVVRQTNYVGEPIWVTATAGSVQNVRYPFHAAVEDAGCNRIEVNHNGVPLPQLPIRSQANLSGIGCGSSAPPGSPPDRLPLHALFAINKPGRYSVRWTELSSNTVSDWLTFDVRQPTPEQREGWLTGLLAHPPDSAGLLAGDFLPSLLAGAPDPRVLQAFVSYMHADNAMVSGMAAAGLEHFPLSEVQPAVVDSIVRSGPSDALAYFATQHLGWTRSDEDRVVHATTAYLLPIGNGSQSAAAYTLLHFIFYVPNHAWPADAELKAYADEQVLSAAPSVIEKDDTSVIHELAVYLGSMSSRRSHELLLQLAGRSDNAGEQARIALTWHPEATDLSNLAAVLVTPQDADPRGTDRSSLPYSLVKGMATRRFPIWRKQ